MKNYRFWMEVIKNKLYPAILVVVSEHRGSSPGKTGFKMLITSDSLIGSIGGGIMEYELVNEIRDMIENSTFNNFERTLIHQSDNDRSSGLVCSGEQTIIVMELTEPLIYEIVKSYGKKLFINYSEDEIVILDHRIHTYSELLDFDNRVFIFGDGHVGRSVCRALEPLDFHITVIDHRDEQILGHNQYAHKIAYGGYDIIDSYDFDGAYILVLSYGMAVDRAILNMISSNSTTPKFLGVMGSRSKHKVLRTHLREDGIDDTFISLITGPIGLPIADGTPEEIAVAITAQLLSVKNSM